MRNGRDIIVLGAGAVGVSAALALQKKGAAVTLIDRKPPASETSGGNAGIISSSPVPFNTPGLWPQLPGMLFGDGAALHLDITYALRHLPWFVRFLANATPASARRRCMALHRLMIRGGEMHRQWLPEYGDGARLRASGWLKCYRSEKSFARAAAERALWDAAGVTYRILSPSEIAEFSPALHSVFARAAFLQDSMAIVNPRHVVRSYADGFCKLGGRLVRAECAGLSRVGDVWEVKLQGGDCETAAEIVVALGPWSRDFLKPAGVVLPMNYERGGHRHFAAAPDLLPVPVADMDGGYMMTMQDEGLRITSGVCYSDSPAALTAQLDRAEKFFRDAVPAAGDALGEDWHGARPTTPDCLPLIGPLRQPGLWLATAHQHIGITTAPASGEMLAEWMLTGEPGDAAPFHPARYGL